MFNEVKLKSNVDPKVKQPGYGKARNVKLHIISFGNSYCNHNGTFTDSLSQFNGELLTINADDPNGPS